MNLPLWYLILYICIHIVYAFEGVIVKGKEENYMYRALDKKEYYQILPVWSSDVYIDSTYLIFFSHPG